MKLCK